MLDLKRKLVYALNVSCLGLILTWCVCQATERTSVEPCSVFHHLAFSQVAKGVLSKKCDEVPVHGCCHTWQWSLWGMTVMTMGRGSWGSFPYPNAAGATLFRRFSVLLYVGCLQQFRGSFSPCRRGTSFLNTVIWSVHTCPLHSVDGEHVNCKPTECTPLSAGAEISAEQSPRFQSSFRNLQASRTRPSEPKMQHERMSASHAFRCASFRVFSSLLFWSRMFSFTFPTR